MHRLFIFLITSFFCLQNSYGQKSIFSGQVKDAVTGMEISKCSIFIKKTNDLTETDQDGYFQIRELKEGQYEVMFFAEGYESKLQLISLKNGKNNNLTILLEQLLIELNTVDLTASSDDFYGQRKLNNVEGMAIYAAKKNEVIEMKNMVANLATNNARQVYKGIAGLNIWENDGSGLQLNIGARGLDPNRTSNFNTRQNGYDISADALGYPESYYTPPTQALERIEIVRGAASLQYGPQFGGLLNFVMKKGPTNKAIEFTSENTIGSWGLFSTFNSLGGEKNGWNYYTYYQRKRGDGWRANSKFHQNSFFGKVGKRVSDKLNISLEYTHMDYLSQQPGGLMDFEIEQDARQSKRERNWFKVGWNLAAINIDYHISDKTKINNRSFYLNAKREALGELGPINRPDPLRERDLIAGKYKNFGSETRLIHRYEIGNQLTTFLIGSRYYEGFSESKQGDANNGDGPDFKFLNPGDPENFAYDFPSRNISLFAENLFNINTRWTVTPGARFEFIRTSSEGYFKKREFSGGQLIFEQKFADEKENNRSLLLLGIGSGYKLTGQLEAYANISQNYRSINFSDLAFSNPNLIIDSLLKDEEGFNADLGIRGTLFEEALRFDATLFYLKYQDRIGLGEKDNVSFRTNIGDARIMGLEVFAESDLLKIMKVKSNEFDFSSFINFSFLQGEYTSGLTSFVGNEVELIPPFSLKTGFNFRWKTWKAAYQFAYVGEHYSDATNAVFVSNATRGLISSYHVQDFSLSYLFRRFRFQAGINNLSNEQYFTRRAASYPGPGIIPADGRSYYFSVALRL